MAVPILPPRPPTMSDALDIAEALVPAKLEAYRAAQRRLEENRRTSGRKRTSYLEDTKAWIEERRRIEALRVPRGAGTKSQTKAQALENDVTSRLEDLRHELLILLQKGDVIGFVLPDRLSEPALLIPVDEWQHQGLGRLRPSTIRRGRLDGRKVVFCVRDQVDLANPKRRSGRPSAPARDALMNLFLRRRSANETLETASKEARHIIGELRIAAPSLELPQVQTVAKWLRPYY